MAILLLAFGLRLYRLGGESLWYDETFSAYLARQTLPQLIAHTARDIHPPGYYIILHGWQALTSASPAHGLEYLLAWASLFPTLLIVALTAAIGQRLGGRRSALVAALLAAVHPPQVWFAQEVRMYAWGALFVLLTLWAVQRLVDANRRSRAAARLAWFVYVAAATAALYTVYYAVFWLFAVNLYMLSCAVRRRLPHVGAWLLAQCIIVVAYLPWLPTFVRQVVDPPVPPWREPWRRLPDAFQAGSEALAALAVGHTPPLGVAWPWALVVLAVLALSAVYANDGQKAVVTPTLLLACGPLALLLATTAMGWPIYHVRYIALSAPALPLLAGLATTLPAPIRRLAYVLQVLLLLISLAGLRTFWFDPTYAADDHRSAVSDLAAQWRPGDAILVNAGWVYTAVDVYWPREAASLDASLPPALGPAIRLGAPLAPDDLSTPRLIMSGSLDADPSLGWGLSESDFYGVTAEAATVALDDLARRSTRVWHYRLYDTVSDPTGVLRAALQRHAQPSFSRAYPGPSYLLLERYDFGVNGVAPAAKPPLAAYADGLALLTAAAPTQSRAGQYLYVTLAWRTEQAAPDHDLAVSLRAMRDTQLIAQADDAIPSAASPAAAPQTLALAIPAGTPPGPIRLTLLVYHRADLRPLELPQSGAVKVDLGTVDLMPPAAPP